MWGSTGSRRDDLSARADKVDHEHAFRYCHCHCHTFAAAHLRHLIMTDTLRTIKNKIKEIYGDDFVSWFENSYIVDWQVSEGSFLKNNAPDERWQGCRVGIIHSPVNSFRLSQPLRGISPLMTHLFSIPTLSNSSVSPYVRSDLITYTPVIRIPSYTNNLIAGVGPVILVIVVGGYRTSLHELHHGLLAAISGRFVPCHTTRRLSLSR